MTHKEFWDLYERKKIQLSIFQGIVDNGDGYNPTQKTAEAFQHNGKYFLRVHTNYEYTTGRRSNGKRYKMEKSWDAIKEFDNKSSANSYFKKFFSDCEYKRVQI